MNGREGVVKMRTTTLAPTGRITVIEHHSGGLPSTAMRE